MVRGQVVTGKFGEILMRVKQGKEAELGELFIAESDAGKVLLQAFDLQYGSQISRENLELVSGMMLEQNKIVGSSWLLFSRVRNDRKIHPHNNHKVGTSFRFSMRLNG